LHSRCVICCEEYKSGTRVATLPCAHQYHSECITTWLKLNKVWHSPFNSMLLHSHLTAKSNCNYLHGWLFHLVKFYGSPSVLKCFMMLKVFKFFVFLISFNLFLVPFFLGAICHMNPESISLFELLFLWILFSHC
jgi:hypothetical protein